MEEAFEEQRQERPDIDRFVGLIRRRHMHFLVALLLGWAVVWGASWILHPKYKSNTLILVEQPGMSQSYIQPNVSDNLQDRLASITEQILSRTRLLMIIQKLHLYDKPEERLADDEKIAAIRKDIDIELVRDPKNNQISAFRISYTARDPHVAQSVTRELTDLFIKENLQTRQQRSQDTTTFLKEQLALAQNNLAQQNAKLKAFQAAHQGALPSQQASNLQILSGLQAQLQGEQDALNTAKQQRAYLQSMTQQYKGLQASGQLASAGEQSLSPVAAADRDLQQLRAKLADLRSRYTDRYPDVQVVKDQIARTEQLKARLMAERAQGGSASQHAADSQSASGGADGSANPAVLQLQGQTVSNRVEIANREQSIRSLQARIAEYQARLNAGPVTEQQMAELTREFDQSKSNYDDLLKKENASEMATNIEQMQQDDRFVMLDPPSLPDQPDFPNRLKFCGIGLGVGALLGLIVVAAFEFFDDRLQTEKEIKAVLPVGVISDIPELKTPARLAREKNRLGLGVSFGVFVAVTILAGSIYSYFKG